MLCLAGAGVPCRSAGFLAGSSRRRKCTAASPALYRRLQPEYCGVSVLWCTIQGSRDLQRAAYRFNQQGVSLHEGRLLGQPIWAGIAWPAGSAEADPVPCSKVGFARACLYREGACPGRRCRYLRQAGDCTASTSDQCGVPITSNRACSSLRVMLLAGSSRPPSR